MPRPKRYEDDATRAAAWRARQQQEYLQAADIARQAQRLHHLLQKAAEQGNDEAASLVGPSVSETLKNLQHHFQHRP
jgi:formiminotetrahydrofolate cyclodeaminase